MLSSQLEVNVISTQTSGFPGFMYNNTSAWGGGSNSRLLTLRKILKLHFASAVSLLAVSYARLLQMSLTGF